MNEMRMVRELYGDVAPDPRLETAIRARLANAYAEGEPAHGRKPPLFTRKRLAITLAGAVATVLAAALAVNLMPEKQAAETGTWASHWTQVGPEVNQSAEPVLLAAGKSAAAAPQGRYWHIREVEASLQELGKPGSSYLFETRSSSESWTDRDFRGSGFAFIHQELGARPASGADRAAWKRDGARTTLPDASPFCQKEECATTKITPRKPEKSTRGVEGYSISLGNSMVPVEKLRKLPADPAALRTRILKLAKKPGKKVSITDLSEKEPPTDDEIVHDAAQMIITTLPVSTEVRAAAFQMMAKLPGVKNLGQARDKQGRLGTRLMVPGDEKYRDELLIDERSGTLLSARTVQLKHDPEHPLRKPGMTVSDTTYEKAEWTDSKP